MDRFGAVSAGLKPSNESFEIVLARPEPTGCADEARAREIAHDDAAPSVLSTRPAASTRAYRSSPASAMKANDASIPATEATGVHEPSKRPAPSTSSYFGSCQEK